VLLSAVSLGKSHQQAMAKLTLEIISLLQSLKGSRLDLSCQEKKSKNVFAQLFPVAPLVGWPALGRAEDACCGGGCDVSVSTAAEESSSVLLAAAAVGSRGKLPVNKHA